MSSLATLREKSLKKFSLVMAFADTSCKASFTTFNNCVFNENSISGIFGSESATIHLHGEASAIHSNGTNGISAYGAVKVLIHLPSHHNTSYNNGDQDRRTGY